MVYPITYYNNTTSITAYYCWESDDNLAYIVAIYQLMVMFIVPAVFMLFCYFCVIQELWTSTKTIRAMTQNLSSSSIIKVQQDGQSYVIRWSAKETSTNSGRVGFKNGTGVCNHQTAAVTEIREARKKVSISIKFLQFSYQWIVVI